MPLLPPPAKSQDPAAAGQIAAYVDGLVNECFQRMTVLNLPSQVEDNINLFLGNPGKVITYRGNKYPVNRIMLVCLANAAIQVGDRPKITYTARESGETPRYYLNTQLAATPATMPILAEIDQASQADGKPYRVSEEGGFPEALPPYLAERIQQAIGLSKQQAAAAQAMGMPAPPGVPEDLLIEVNDHTTAEALQEAVDAKLEVGGFGQAIVENVLYNNIIGFQHMLYEWDDEHKRPIFTNPHMLQVFQDPTKTDVARAQYVIYDQFLGREEALALFPDLAHEINQWAAAGPPQVPGAFAYRMPLQYMQSYFYRETLFVRTCWLRNQPYPLTLEEAMQAGKVSYVDATSLPAPEPVEEPAGGDPEAKPGFFQGIMDAAKRFVGMHGEGTEEAHADGSPTPGPAAPGDAVPGEPDGTDPAEAAEVGAEGPEGSPDASPVITPKILVLTDTNEPTHEGADNWPTRLGIRQVRIIVGHVVDDRECEYVEIPMLQNVNIPIPWSPYGIGEPQNLSRLQAALNASIGDLIEHAEYTAFPLQFVPKSVQAELPSELQNMYIRPGMRLTIRDELYNKFNGKPISTLDPPAMPPEAFKRIDTLLNLFDTQSDQSKTLSGQASATWSGDAIARLQQAAKSTILFKSGRTEDMLRQLAKLVAGSIIYRMTPEELADGFRKYPLHVWYDLHNRFKAMEFDVAVAVTSGSGANKQAQTQNLIMARQQGVEISQQTIMESLDADPKVEASNNASWERDKASAMASSQQMAPQPPMANPETQREAVPAMPPAAA